jgi:hypothetical protein
MCEQSARVATTALRAVHPSKTGAHQLVRPWYMKGAPFFEVIKTMIASGINAV